MDQLSEMIHLLWHECLISARLLRLYKCIIPRFSASCVRDFEIVNRYSWFWNSLVTADRPGEFNFFQKYLCKNWYKNWYLHFHGTYNHQIWQASISRGVASNETNQTGASEISSSSLILKGVITSFQQGLWYQIWAN